jgi:FkbM family methyltransferase
MRDNFLKQLAKWTFFRPGAVRRIRFGALAGMRYRVSSITGLSAWYSGPEKRHHQAFAKLVRPGDCVMDIGANWGLHTLHLSRLVGREGRVIALEPFPPAWRELEWHIHHNACTNVQLQRLAASDRDGTEQFLAGESAYTGHLAGQNADAAADPHAVVKVRTVDGLVEDLGLKRLRLMKIDVEGAESRVLSGAAATLDRLTPFLIVDLHTPEQDVRVASFLHALGYNLSRLDGPPIRRLDQGWPHPEGVWGSILAEPSRASVA